MTAVVRTVPFLVGLLLAGCAADPRQPAAVQTVEQHAQATGEQIHATARQVTTQYCAQPYQTRLGQHQALMTAASVAATAAGAPPLVGLAAQAVPPLVLCPGDPGYIAQRDGPNFEAPGASAKPAKAAPEPETLKPKEETP